jgi:very-short-patch-repair endonuclease
MPHYARCRAASIRRMDLDDMLLRLGGVGSRAELLPLLGRHRLDNSVKSGQLVAIFPRAYARPWDADLVEIRRRAALKSVGGEGALSHLTALEMRSLPVPDGAPLHVTAYLTRHPRGVPGKLVVHRTQAPLGARELDGMPVVGLETAIATSWSLLAGPEQRAPLIEAYRRRLIPPARLLRATESAFWIRGVRSLRDVVSLVLAGCESELELWGYMGVFDIPELSDASRQRVVRVDGKTYRLDVAFDEEMLNVELDGRAFHASPQQWERDIARDLAVAKLGWQTIRLPHRRLFGDVDGCRRDVVAVREARRRRRSA